MERNIDRNLRMAKGEARRFFGITGRGIGRSGVFLVALLTTIGGFQFLEPYVDSRLFHDWLGWMVLVGFAAVSALLFLLLKVLGAIYGEGGEMDSFVINGLVRRRAALAGDIERTYEALRKMVPDFEALAAAHGVDEFHFRSTDPTR